MSCTAIGEVLKTYHVNKCKYSKYDIGRKYFVGGVRNKENVAIFSGEFNKEIDLNTLLQVPDDKQLTVWTDKDKK